MPVTEDIAKRVLCLPLYYELEGKHLKYINQIRFHKNKYKLYKELI